MVACNIYIFLYNLILYKHYDKFINVADNIYRYSTSGYFDPFSAHKIEFFQV